MENMGKNLKHFHLESWLGRWCVEFSDILKCDIYVGIDTLFMN